MIVLLHEKSVQVPKTYCGVPAIETKSLSFNLPKKCFDYVLVTSPRALQATKKWPRAKNYIAIGSKTAEALRGCPYEVQILKKSSSEGFVEFFKRKKPSSIFFPRSKRADPKSVQKLRRQGHRVSVVHSYETRLLNLKPFQKKIFSADAIFLMSPSGLDALKKSFGRGRLRRLDTKWVAIGKTTASAIRKSLEVPVITAKEPSIPAMKRAFLTSQKKRSRS